MQKLTLYEIAENARMFLDLIDSGKHLMKMENLMKL